jgi:DNA topoisomerase IB
MPRLRRSDCSAPGIRRRGRGRGFSYEWAEGGPVNDEETLSRISALAIPPAWRDVWISPWPNGHIQATGTDAAGRRQYRYHDQWRAKRDFEKFERMVRFGRALPRLRRQVAEHLARPGLPKEKVLAAAVRLLDLGYFRIGGEEYAEEHETFGLSTMERKHVRVSGDEMHFDYPAKGGARRKVTVRDREVAAVLRTLKRRRDKSSDLLAWREAAGRGRQRTMRYVDVKAEDVNAYLKEGIGEEFSAKDFRTWSATVLAAARLCSSGWASANAGRRLAAATAKEVSAYLGNTPAVCRSSYIDPRIFDRHEQRDEAFVDLGSMGAGSDLGKARSAIEEAVIALLEESPADSGDKARAVSGRARKALAAAQPPGGPSSKPRRRRSSSSSTSESSSSRSTPKGERSEEARTTTSSEEKAA